MLMMQAMRITERQKRTAREWVRRMVRRGALDRAATCACGARATDGHHKNYAQPLAVVWVCRLCHAALHRPSELGQLTLWLGA